MTDITQGSIGHARTGSSIKIELHFEVLTPLRRASIAIGFQTPDFLNIATQVLTLEDMPETLPEGNYVFRLLIDNLPLMPGPYSLRTSVVEGLLPQTIFYCENITTLIVSAPEMERAKFSGEGFFAVTGQASFCHLT